MKCLMISREIMIIQINKQPKDTMKYKENIVSSHQMVMLINLILQVEI